MKGSCLCGGVQYEVDQLATPIQHCSCRTCQKAHGAAFNTGAGVSPDHFRWTQGEDLLKGFESSPGKLRYFCSNCGSQLLARKGGYPVWVLRVATLDDDPGRKPERHIWTAQESPWLAYDSPDIAKYPEWQPGR